MTSRSLDLAPGCLGSAHARPRRSEGAGRFELYKDPRGEFRFYLKAANGQIIASSEGYKSKVAAMDGIKAVQIIAPAATMVDKSG